MSECRDGSKEPDRLVSAFRDDADSFCRFIDDLRAGRTTAAPYTVLLCLLSNLVKTGAEIPFDFPEHDRRDTEEIDSEQLRLLASQIDAAVAPACAALVAHFGNDEEAAARASMLWDDLTDLYVDLRRGLSLYERGGRDDVAEAVWWWQFGYEHHWGSHLFRALATVHELRYVLSIE